MKYSIDENDPTPFMQQHLIQKDESEIYHDEISHKTHTSVKGIYNQTDVTIL